MTKKFSTKVQFRGYLDTGGSEYEGVGRRDVERAIDDMSEDELRNFMKASFENVISSRKK